MLIDNYIDENTITHLAKKNEGVPVLLFSRNVSKQLTLDVQKANEQWLKGKLNIRYKIEGSGPREEI